VANEDQAARRLKRGGGATLVSLDFETAEGELASLDVPDPRDPEELFRHEWSRSLFGLAVDRLRSELAARGKETWFHLFERYDLDDAGVRYEDLARELAIPVTSVTNHLHAARREFRRQVLEVLRELTATEEEFRAEARLLTGREPR
jgi:DNA-directed RNA polymerase specialized sigma24 family protein